MTIVFEPNERPDHLVLDCAGSFSYESMLHTYEQAFALAAAAGRAAVLVDARRLTGSPPRMLDRVNGAMFVARLQAAQNPKIRLAVLGNEPMVDRQRIGEIVAAARGAVARVFTDETEALDWLLQRPKAR